MTFTIDKQFDFCYGHRVHNQRLDTKFTDNGCACLACRHLHGHQGTVKVFLEATQSNMNISKTGMVTDFKHLGWFKNFIDDVLDHKMILDLEDPLLSYELPELCTLDKKMFDMDSLIYDNRGFYTVDMNKLVNDLSLDMYNPYDMALYEKYEGIVLVDFVPTSENLTAWLLSVVEFKMKDMMGVKVKAVEYWETPKSHCRVEA